MRWFSYASYCQVVLCYILLRGGYFAWWCFFSAYFSRRSFCWTIFFMVVEELAYHLRDGKSSRPLLYCVLFSAWQCFFSTCFFAWWWWRLSAPHLCVVELLDPSSVRWWSISPLPLHDGWVKWIDLTLKIIHLNNIKKMYTNDIVNIYGEILCYAFG